MDPNLRRSLTPELRSTAIERANSLLLRVIRANFNTQYVSRTPSLAEFRNAISSHGSVSDTLFIENFRGFVPLSDYDSYKPFMAAFDKRPCEEAELENIFAPGLPSFLAISSATSGREPKLFPKYLHFLPDGYSNFPGSTAAVSFLGYKEVKEVEREPGSVVEKIPVCIASAGLIRALQGWSNIDDDGSRMSLIMPGFVAPFAASVIKHLKSFLVIHALFALVCRDLDYLHTTFSTLFYDLVRHIDEEWDMLLSSIRNGEVPDLPGVREVQSHLQAHLHANPDRAAELGEIGPPFSCEGWVARVWPKLKTMSFICSGTFATVVPEVKSIVGPTITIRTHGYGSSESSLAGPCRPDDLDTFILRSSDLVEFLDVSMEESHESLVQAWELEVGRQYEIVLTTNDGLWRYRLGDVINVIGFDGNDGSPVFGISGRRNLMIRFRGMSMTDTHLTLAIRSVSPDVMQVHEFTTVPDYRQSTQTVGYFVELAGTLGPNAHLAPLRLAEGLAAANAAFQSQLETAAARYPSVRIVRPSTFAEYRQWRAERTNAGPGQVKVPAVLLDAISREWILERVIGEL